MAKPLKISFYFVHNNDTLEPMILRFFVFLLIWCLLGGISLGGKKRAYLLLSWNLKPYWDFVEGFEKASSFKTKVFVLEKTNYFNLEEIEKADIIIPVGHRALKFVLKQSHLKPIFATLILAPEFIEDNSLSTNILGGIYLRISPEIFLPILKKELQPIFHKDFLIGIPFSFPENRKFVEKAKKLAISWNIKVIPIPFPSKGTKETFRKLLNQIDVLYLIPDPFLESEEAIEEIIKEAVLQKKIIVGYNRFFLKKGALLALVIDYSEAGRKSALFLQKCLEKNLSKNCGWQFAPFKVLINEKLIPFYKSCDL